MSVRISLYDFFAYTIPGVFYLLIAGYAAVTFSWVPFDLQTINSLSLGTLIILAGAGYVVGMVCDRLSAQWGRLFGQRGTSTRAYNEFLQKHPDVELHFRPSDYPVLLNSLKATHHNGVDDIEHFNVTCIMLRNVSLGFGLLALVEVMAYFILVPLDWRIALAAIFVSMSIMAGRLSVKRRGLFHRWLYAAIMAHSLAEKQWVTEIPLLDENQQ